MKFRRLDACTLRFNRVDASTDAQILGISLVPGQKLCPTCHRELTKQTKDHYEQTAQMPDIEENDDGDVEFDFAKDRTRESLDSSLIYMDVSPMKLHAVASHSKVAYVCLFQSDLDVPFQLMKEKMKVSDRRRKIQILTMVPRSWSIE